MDFPQGEAGPSQRPLARPGRTIRQPSESKLSFRCLSRPAPVCLRQPGRRALLHPEAREATHPPPFLGVGRAGRDCTPARRMHTAIDCMTTRSTGLVRAPRHRGRAAPPGAAPYRFLSDDPCRGVASHRPGIEPGLIGAAAASDEARSAAPAAPHLIPPRTPRDAPAPSQYPRPTVSRPPAGSTYRLRLMNSCLRHSRSPTRPGAEIPRLRSE